MVGFIIAIMSLVGLAGVAYDIGQTKAQREIWASCVATNAFKAKDTEFTCQPVRGNWDGQPVLFPKKEK